MISSKVAMGTRIVPVRAETGNAEICTMKENVPSRATASFLVVWLPYKGNVKPATLAFKAFHSATT